MDAINNFMQKLSEFMSKETSGLMSELMSEMKVSMPTGSSASFDSYQVLGLTKDCTDAELKTRYHDIMKTIHPDVTGGKTTFLASMTNAAYSMICKQRGLKSG